MRECVAIVLPGDYISDVTEGLVAGTPTHGDALDLERLAVGTGNLDSGIFLGAISRSGVVKKQIAGKLKARARRPRVLGEFFSQLLGRFHLRDSPESVLVEHRAPPF